MSNEFGKSGLSVTVRNNNVTQAFRKLKKLVQDENVLTDYMSHQAYEPPSVERRRLKAQARKRWLKKVREFRDEGKWRDK